MAFESLSRGKNIAFILIYYVMNTVNSFSIMHALLTQLMLIIYVKLHTSIFKGKCKTWIILLNHRHEKSRYIQSLVKEKGAMRRVYLPTHYKL